MENTIEVRGLSWTEYALRGQSNENKDMYFLVDFDSLEYLQKYEQ